MISSTSRFFVVSVSHPWIPIIVLAVHATKEAAEADAARFRNLTGMTGDIVVRDNKEAIEEGHVITMSTDMHDDIRLPEGELQRDEWSDDESDE